MMSEKQDAKVLIGRKATIASGGPTMTIMDGSGRSVRLLYWSDKKGELIATDPILVDALTLVGQPIEKAKLLTVEVKSTDIPLVRNLIDALREDFENLPEGVKVALNEILLKDCK